MSSNSRKLQYSLAINEALHQMMETDDSVFVIGQGVKSPWYVGSTANGLLDRFGPKRVIDTPVSENAMTGAAVGAAIAGMRPIVVHPRIDFMLYAFDPIINQAANWHYMSGGGASVPAVIWGIINRGGEQAAQHSQALHALFTHIPGLKVVMPSTAYDAKGLMIAAIQDNNPVIYIDDRKLYGEQGEVPEEVYAIEIGKGIIRRKGHDLTVVAISSMVREALEAAQTLSKEGIELEVMDPRSLKPFDEELLFQSVKKTGRLLVVDVGWENCGVSAEIITKVTTNMFKYLKHPPTRIALPNIPAPASHTLENAYYPAAGTIIQHVQNLFTKKQRGTEYETRSAIC